MSEQKPEVNSLSQQKRVHILKGGSMADFKPEAAQPAPRIGGEPAIPPKTLPQMLWDLVMKFYYNGHPGFDRECEELIARWNAEQSPAPDAAGERVDEWARDKWGNIFTLDNEKLVVSQGHYRQLEQWLNEAAHELGDCDLDGVADGIRELKSAHHPVEVKARPDREMLEAVAEDGLLVTWDKDYKFNFSQVVRLMAEFAENQLEEFRPTLPGAEDLARKMQEIAAEELFVISGMRDKWDDLSQVEQTVMRRRAENALAALRSLVETPEQKER